MLLAVGCVALAQSAPTWDLVVCAAKDYAPYSNQEEQGFENQMMTLLAQDLDAHLTYVWLPHIQVFSQNQRLLNEGKCDLLLDVGDNSDDFLTTIPYLQTTYYFVTRSDAAVQIESFDDEALRSLRIGVVTASPPDEALGLRGMRNNVRHYITQPNSPAPQMIADLTAGEIDLAVIYGPDAGPLVQRNDQLQMVPVAPQVELSGLLMVYQTTMGMRKDDTDLRDLLNDALAHKWDEIQDALDATGIPVLPLPRPVTTVGG